MQAPDICLEKKFHVGKVMVRSASWRQASSPIFLKICFQPLALNHYNSPLKVPSPRLPPDVSN